MSTVRSARPEVIPVRRSELRQNQSRVLRRAKGRTVLAVQGAHGRDDEKYVLDKKYFDQLLQRHSSLLETLEIMADRKLFGQILAAADALEEDLRQGKLHSLEEAFEES